jgi:hypothetical protein
MPSAEDLLAMPNNTVFWTEGFHEKNDGQGGYYLNTTTWTRGSLRLTGSPTHYLVPLDSNGRYMEYIEVGRLGLRPYNEAIEDWANVPVKTTHSRDNSTILSSIVLPANKATLKFPVGKFFFESPININGANRQLNIKGETISARMDSALFNTDFSQGTMLVFPFLGDGDYAINSAFGSIEDVVIAGNPSTYNIAFDRTKARTAPNEVVTETIAVDGSTEIKCTVIKKLDGHISNVYVTNFYTGIGCEISRININNVHISSCHYGLDIKNDAKCMGVYGGNVHTLIRMQGAISSVIGVRSDSCVHAIQILGGNSFTLSDVDGDWCTDSLILLGDGTSQMIETSTFSQVHGRCCTLKSYDSNSETSPKISDLADSEGYGIIRVSNNTVCKNNYFLINRTGGTTFDDTSRYKNPDIILTHGATNVTISDNTVICPSAFPDEPNELFETNGVVEFEVKYDDLYNVYHITNDGAEIINSLKNLTDVDLTTPQSGDVLVYDGQKWGNEKQNIENTTENTELQIIDDNENVGVEIGSDDWENASFMEKYGFGGFPYGYENLPPKNKFSGILEGDMFVVDGGKGRWNGIDTGNALYGGHLFEGWNAPHDARLTFGIGIKNKDVSFIATFRPHSTSAQNDGYYGVVKIGDDREKTGTVFTNNLSKHNGLMCLATSIPNDTRISTQRLATSGELAQTDYDSTANIPYGAMYFDLTEQKVKVYTSSGWKALAWEV